ncbi:hypothetical protein VTN77DRAFT_933 [Rasamsonia byssochlamydoides]|uniref:uncharacterized protein n=1 Tax=Rasamsonia byssochlamydoides TaxID=89139 RepID=UPI00374221DD
MLLKSLFVVLASALSVSAIPQPTPSPTASPSTSTTLGSSTTVTVPPSSTITPSPTLNCSKGSTAVYTTDCTMGYPVSYCYSPPPPIQCSSGYFPGVYAPGHCETASTCYPLNAPWLTTKCSNGGIPYSTSTLYVGTLAGGETTTISMVECSCAANQWYSMTLGNGGSTVDTFCMPYSNCPAGMTTSTTSNVYCTASPTSGCVTSTTDYCKCANPTQTAVYPSGDGAVATGCA